MKYSDPHPPSLWNINSFACHFFTFSPKRFACRYRTAYTYIFIIRREYGNTHFFKSSHTKQPHSNLSTLYTYDPHNRPIYPIRKMIKYTVSRSPSSFCNPSSKRNTKIHTRPEWKISSQRIAIPSADRWNLSGHNHNMAKRRPKKGRTHFTFVFNFFFFCFFL